MPRASSGQSVRRLLTDLQGIYILYIEIGDHGVKRDGRDTFFRGNGIPGVLELMKRGTSLMIRPVVIC